MDNLHEFSPEFAIKTLLDKWKTIVWAVLASVVIAFLVLAFLAEDSYVARISFYVGDPSGEAVVDINSLNTAKGLVNDYLVLLNSDRVLDQVVLFIDRPGYSLGKVRGMITAQTIQNTSMFEVKVTTNKATLSADVANFIGYLLPYEAEEIFQKAFLKVIDSAKVPVKADYSKWQVCIVISGLLGFGIAVIGVLIGGFMEQREVSNKEREIIEEGNPKQTDQEETRITV